MAERWPRGSNPQANDEHAHSSKTVDLVSWYDHRISLDDFLWRRTQNKMFPHFESPLHFPSSSNNNNAAIPHPTRKITQNEPPRRSALMMWRSRPWAERCAHTHTHTHTCCAHSLSGCVTAPKPPALWLRSHATRETIPSAEGFMLIMRNMRSGPRASCRAPGPDPCLFVLILFSEGGLLWLSLPKL